MVLSPNSFTGWDPRRGIGPGMIGPLPAGRVSTRQELATSQGRDRDGPRLVVRVVQNEILQRCVIPAKAGIQSPGTRPSLDARFRGHDTDVSESSPHFE
jgi:hypothetical protein